MPRVEYINDRQVKVGKSTHENFREHIVISDIRQEIARVGELQLGRVFTEKKFQINGKHSRELGSYVHDM
jgi:hypothetical protein